MFKDTFKKLAKDPRVRKTVKEKVIPVVKKEIEKRKSSKKG